MNQYIEEQIRFKYGKSFEEMSDEERRQITEITLFAEDFRGNPTGIKISDLEHFPNIQRCLIKKFNLTDYDLGVLANRESLRGVQFSNCDLRQTTSLNSSLEIVVLDGCVKVPKHFLKGSVNLRSLRVVNQGYFDVTSLDDCSLLENVYLQNTVIVNLMGLRRLKSLKSVNLDGSTFNLLALQKLKGSVEIEYQSNSSPDLSR